MLGKRILETSTLEKVPVVVGGDTLNNMIIRGEDGVEIIRLEVGLESQTPTALCYDIPGEDGDIDYIPYTITSRHPLDSYSCLHVSRLLSDTIYFNTGLTIDLVGLYYDDGVLGCGVLEDNKLHVTENMRVKKTPINLS